MEVNSVFEKWVFEKLRVIGKLVFNKKRGGVKGMVHKKNRLDNLKGQVFDDYEFFPEGIVLYIGNEMVYISIEALKEECGKVPNPLPLKYP